MFQNKPAATLRIGLLLDAETIPAWVNELIGALQQQAGISIVVAVINKGKKGYPKPSALAYMAYRMLRKADQKLMPVAANSFRRVLWEPGGIPVIGVMPEQTTFSDRFPAEAIKQLKAFQPDILLRFGFRILRGDILQGAPMGVWSLHHGDTAAYRGGPPAFWEVVNRESVTGVTLQRLTERLDGGEVLAKAFIRTDRNSFHRNQVKIYEAGRRLFFEKLCDAAKLSDEIKIASLCKTDPPLYAAPLYKNPNFSEVVRAGWQQLLFNARRKWSGLFFVSQWQIGYRFSPSQELSSNLYQFTWLIPPPDRIWADPFIVKHEDVFFLFLEEKIFNKTQGWISCLRLDNTGKLLDSKPFPVLEKAHHLSYPFVFQWKDRWFMMPEAAASKSVTLYESKSFPLGWEPVKDWFTGIYTYDATLHWHEGLWYLFCTQKDRSTESSDAYLHIYFCNDFLTDDWLPHPANPIYRDVRLSRPAGKLFLHNNRLCRPSQIGAPHYGNGIRWNEVKMLDQEEFSEITLQEILPSKTTSALMGYHTINYTEGFTVIDRQVRRNRFS